MQHKKILDVIGTILLLAGMFFAFLPHAFHAAAGFSESSHIKHVIYGMAGVISALAILVYNNNALKFQK